jgi:hypothetical protein
MSRCYICLDDFAEYLPVGGASKKSVNCPKCGKYDISDILVSCINEGTLNPIQRANISGWLRHQPSEPSPPFLLSDDFEKLKRLRTPTVAEKARMVFNLLCEKYPVAGRFIDVLEKIYDIGEMKDEDIKYMQGISSIVDIDEFKYIIDKYIIKEQRLLSHNSDYKEYLITPTGWIFFDDNPFPESEVAFVAMSFKNELDRFYNESIVHAVKRAGWNPLRIKEERHNNYITDMILSGIKRSRFVIADFTENCEGAYFEAGYARGLGLPVIHTVREDYLNGGDPKKKLHFDTLQIYHLPWKDEDHKKNSEKLYHHIIATIGQGPIQLK